MKLLLLLACLLSSCATHSMDKEGVQKVSEEIQRRLMDTKVAKTNIQKNSAGTYSTRARITFYCAAEDGKWSNRVASDPKLRGKHGETVAVDPRIIPYGSRVKIPALSHWFGDDEFKALDTGSAVKSKKASNGKSLVFDIFCSSKSQMKKLMKTAPQYATVFWRTS